MHLSSVQVLIMFVDWFVQSSLMQCTGKIHSLAAAASVMATDPNLCKSFEWVIPNPCPPSSVSFSCFCPPPSPPCLSVCLSHPSWFLTETAVKSRPHSLETVPSMCCDPQRKDAVVPLHCFHSIIIEFKECKKTNYHQNITSPFKLVDFYLNFCLFRRWMGENTVKRPYTCNHRKKSNQDMVKMLLNFLKTVYI